MDTINNHIDTSKFAIMLLVRNNATKDYSMNDRCPPLNLRNWNNAWKWKLLFSSDRRGDK